LQALNKTPEGSCFTDYDEQLASTLSAQAGVAIQRQILLEAYAIKQKQDRDLELARKIQQELLPKQNPSLTGYDIAGWNRPADETGGDCYDFLPLSDGRLGLMLADAVGHGIPAALIIAQCRASIRAVVSSSPDLPETIARVNQLLYSDLMPEQFVTAFIGILDPGANRMTYVSAGQGPLLLYRAADKQVTQLDATALPLAIIPDAEFEAGDPIDFSPGDMMVLLTDGFFEWTRAAETRSPYDQFGIDRVIDVIREHDQKPAREIIGCVYDAVLRYAAGSAQDDDLTAIVIKKLEVSNEM
jgi:phosphoserine phosphatase